MSKMTRLRAATARQANGEGMTKWRRPNVHFVPQPRNSSLHASCSAKISKGPRIRRISVNDQRARLEFSGGRSFINFMFIRVHSWLNVPNPRMPYVWLVKIRSRIGS